MKIFALLSWYDEDPAHLTRCVESLAPIADHLVCVDGAYRTFPGAQAASPVDQWLAIQCAAIRADLKCDALTPGAPWQGGEVEKRAAMFQYARDCGATPDDWLLIIDGDMLVADATGAREALAAVTEDVAEVRWRDVRPDGQFMSDLKFRSLFRALPGLTVKWTHWLYIVPEGQGWRWLWHVPSGHPAPEPAADLSAHLTLHHRRLDRSGDRDAAARAYYQDRDAQNLERPPHW